MSFQIIPLPTNHTPTSNLIHVVDVCCTARPRACSKICVENLRGECTFSIRHGGGGFAKIRQACSKHRTALSVKSNPNCQELAYEFVDVVFEPCYKETYPFDRHRNLPLSCSYICDTCYWLIEGSRLLLVSSIVKISLSLTETGTTLISHNIMEKMDQYSRVSPWSWSTVRSELNSTQSFM